jgi:transcriptional regulator with XRE-family HTH domain
MRNKRLIGKEPMMLKNLASIRRTRGLTQAQLAEMVGCNPTALSWYENDTHTPLITTVVRLADALDVTVDELIGERVDSNAA